MINPVLLTRILYLALTASGSASLYSCSLKPNSGS